MTIREYREVIAISKNNPKEVGRLLGLMIKDDDVVPADYDAFCYELRKGGFKMANIEFAQ